MLSKILEIKNTFSQVLTCQYFSLVILIEMWNLQEKSARQRIYQDQYKIYINFCAHIISLDLSIIYGLVSLHLYRYI